MDHLPAVARRAERVPYLQENGLEYDQLGFLGFNKRVVELIDGTRAEACFLQQWLFFALLGEFSADEKRVPIDKFVFCDAFGRQSVSTTYLLPYLNSWIVFISSLPSEHRVPLLMRANLALNIARSSGYAWADEILEKQPLIKLSFSILGETLLWIMGRVTEQLDIQVPGWMNEEIYAWAADVDKEIMQRMLQRGWCPQSIHMLQGLLNHSVSGLYYASTFPDPPDHHWNRVKHQNCTKNRCEAKILLSEYHVLHAESCSGDCSYVEVEEEDLLKLWSSDEIPLVYYEGDESKGKLRLTPYRPGVKFMIISHVWADGLGNPENNAMVACQVARLSALIERIPEFRDQRPYFWIDSLLVPVRAREVRRIAVRRMYEIYEKAHWTIVLDAGLMTNDVGADYVEPAMRITISGWMQRLWTLQEGVMSRSIFFLFRDELLNIEDLDSMYPAAALQSSLASPARSFYHNLLRPNAANRRADATLFCAVIKSMQWRKTSRDADELRATARILNVDEESIFDQWETKNPMAAFLSTVSEIPSGLIFLPGKRLETPGFRWAPASWMNGRQPDFPDPLELFAQKDRNQPMCPLIGYLQNSGLLVHYPGFRLHCLKGSVWDTWEDDRITFPSNISLQEWYNITLHDELPEVFEDETCLTPSLMLRYRDWLHNCLLAVICCRPRPGGQGEIGLLVSVLGEGTSLTVRRMCRVLILRETRDSAIEQLQRAIDINPTKFLWGTELAHNQAWIVD